MTGRAAHMSMEIAAANSVALEFGIGKRRLAATAGDVRGCLLDRAPHAGTQRDCRQQGRQGCRASIH
jgi:hypothetical protein